MGRPFPSKLPLRMKRSGPPFVNCSLGPPCQYAKRHLDRFSRFCTDNHSVPIFYNGMPRLLKIVPTNRADVDPMKEMVPWAHPSPQPNGIAIGSAVFAGLTIVRQTDRQTEHVTPCVTIGRIYVVLKLTIDKLREESRRWRFHFLSKPGNEVASIIPSPRIFHLLTAF